MHLKEKKSDESKKTLIEKTKNSHKKNNSFP